jgi:anionic cell wall polymer biosynthesis LytR-Cps2A-Psr (LCP) family protein
MPRARHVGQESSPGRRSRLLRRLPIVLALVLVLGVVAGGGYTAFRAGLFLHHVANLNNPVTVIKNEVQPPAGSIAWKLQNGQQVNLLLMGYGGAENDAPWLTDSIMIVSIDPSTHRVLEASIPRDLYVQIDAWQDGRLYSEKINAAFEVGNDPSLFAPGPLRPDFQGKDGAGHLVEATVSRLTGITFDRYAAVDFKAFRTAVDTLGGVTVTMTGPLDDCHYPDYHDGYLNHGVPPGYACPPGAGIHFPAGQYLVNGEQALEIARSRDAVEPDQASDFGRARRQQMIVSAIRQRAGSADVLLKAPQLMDALQNDFKTNLDINDIKALYDFGIKVPDTYIERMGISDQDLVDDYAPYQRGSCGAVDAFALCPEDQTYKTWHTVFAHAFIDPRTLDEHAAVQIVDASSVSSDVQLRVGRVLAPLGLTVSDGGRAPVAAKTVIYDHTGGKDSQTAAWLEEFFGASVVAAPPPTGTQAAAQGLVVVIGNDYARRWYGLG